MGTGGSAACLCPTAPSSTTLRNRTVSTWPRTCRRKPARRQPSPRAQCWCGQRLGLVGFRPVSGLQGFRASRVRYNNIVIFRSYKLNRIELRAPKVTRKLTCFDAQRTSAALPSGELGFQGCRVFKGLRVSGFKKPSRPNKHRKRSENSKAWWSESVRHGPSRQSGGCLDWREWSAFHLDLPVSASSISVQAPGPANPSSSFYHAWPFLSLAA
eukprot:1185088-Prorocentrum_minimum.AAC.1